MSYNDFDLADQGFPSMRADMNSAFQALASNSSYATAPALSYPNQWWYDTTTDILKINNTDGDAWIPFASFNQTNDTWSFASLTVAGNIAAGSATFTSSVKPVTYQETYVANTTGATTTLNLATATNFSVTLTQNTTFAFTNPPTTGTAFAFTLVITQPASAKTIAWPSSVDWANGTAPDAPGNSEVNAYGFMTRNGGTTYYGFLGGAAIG